jgi:hypothetical protein
LARGSPVTDRQYIEETKVIAAILLSRLMETVMRSSVLTNVVQTTIFGLFGSTLIVASLADAVMVSKHFTRHQQTFASESVRHANAFGAHHPNAFVGDQNGFGATSAWRSGMRPDDWRQSENSNWGLRDDQTHPVPR